MNFAAFWMTLAVFSGIAAFASFIVWIRFTTDGDDAYIPGFSVVVSFVLCAVCSAFSALMS